MLQIWECLIFVISKEWKFGITLVGYGFYFRLAAFLDIDFVQL